MSECKKILQAIVELRGESVLGLAIKTGLDQANLSRFLRNRPGGYLGYEKLVTLYSFLGLNLNTVEDEKKELAGGVHRWFFKPVLKEVLSYFFPEGGKRIDCIRESFDRQAGSVDIDNPLSVLYPHNHDDIRIIVLYPPERSAIGLPEDYQFHHSPQDARGMYSPGKAGLTRLIHSDLDVREIDTILGRTDKNWTWNTLGDALDQMGIFPDEVAKKFGLD